MKINPQAPIKIVLGSALLMAAIASAQQEQSRLWQAGGVELKLPSTWEEISPSLLRKKASALGMNADFVYGAQAFKTGDDLIYPYLLVTIKNDGRMADSQWPQLEQSIRQSLENSGVQLERSAWKDRALWLEATAGEAKLMSVILPTEKGLASVSFYSAGGRVCFVATSFRSDRLKRSPPTSLGATI